MDGIRLLETLRQSPVFAGHQEAECAVARCVASLELASGTRDSLDDLSISDQIRALAVSASALAGQGNAQKAEKLLRLGVGKAELSIDKSDPANRALAITGNNLASNLEEKANLSTAEKLLMIYAAQVGRKYWEIAGSWLEIERAEYRLALTYLAAGELSPALEHAQICIEISKENAAEPMEFFFGFEALAKVERSRGNETGFARALDQMRENFEKLNADDKSWCEAILKNLVPSDG